MSALRRIALTATLALAGAPAAIGSPLIVDFADLGFASSAALDIGPDGRVVGIRSDLDGFRAVLWQNGHALSVLNSTPLASAWRARLAPNNSVTLTGTLAGESLERALLITSGGEIVPLGAPGSRALAPTSQPGAVGAVLTDTGLVGARLALGEPPDILPLPDAHDSSAIDINGLGSILAVSRDALGTPSTWLIEAQRTASLIADAVEPAALNDHAAIVGTRSDTNSPILITPDRSIVEIPLLPGALGATPNDINNHSVIVGDALVFDEFFLPTTRAWAWTESHGVIDLTTLAPDGWTLLTADSINDAGQIVGRAEYQGITTGYRLTLIPAPSTLALIPLSLLATGHRKRSPLTSRTRTRPGPSCRRAARPSRVA